MPLQTLLKRLQPKPSKVPVKLLQTWATPQWALLRMLATPQWALLRMLAALLLLLVQTPWAQPRMLVVPLWTLLRMLVLLLLVVPSMLLPMLPRRQCNRTAQQCEKGGRIRKDAALFLSGLRRM
jgi:hypothetical protein